MENDNKKDWFQIKLEGENANPSSFTLNETYYLLRDFQDAVKYEAGKDEFSKDDVSITLKSLEDKCILYTIGGNSSQADYNIEKIVNSLSLSAFNELAYNTLKKLNSFKTRILDKGFFSEFILNGEKVAEINAKTDISIEEIELKDITTIYAEIEKVGGLKPTIRLRLLNGDAITVNTTKTIVKKASKQLYTLTGLVGVATWNKLDYSLLDFKIEDIVELDEKPYLDTFSELKDLFSPTIDKIDNINDILLRD